MPITILSELDAVNTILQAVDEAPVTSLSLSGLYPLDRAKVILNEVSRAVQTEGWAFNTEEGFPLTRDTNGQITLSNNIIHYDADSAYSGVVLRGIRLYDRVKHSYTLDKDVTGTARFLLEWIELPQAARQYITIRACKVFQGRASVPESTYRYTQDDLDAARSVLMETDIAESDWNMLSDSVTVRGVFSIYD